MITTITVMITTLLSLTFEVHIMSRAAKTCPRLFDLVRVRRIRSRDVHPCYVASRCQSPNFDGLAMSGLAISASPCGREKKKKRKQGNDKSILPVVDVLSIRASIAFVICRLSLMTQFRKVKARTFSRNLHCKLRLNRYK